MKFYGRTALWLITHCIFWHAVRVLKIDWLYFVHVSGEQADQVVFSMGLHPGIYPSHKHPVVQVILLCVYEVLAFGV